MLLQIEYCEEKLRCRRVLLMGHFGESFDPGLCKGTCDICSRADGRTFRGAVLHPCIAKHPSAVVLNRSLRLFHSQRLTSSDVASSCNLTVITDC